MLYYQVLRIHQETNKTILFVTHNINEAVSLGNRVVVMSPKSAKEFIIDLPRPRQLDHPLIVSITQEVIEESKDLHSSYYSCVYDGNRVEYEFASTTHSKAR